jgi:protein-L-isoaspartate(D-aspartate) O-methyltransferase
MAQIAERRTDAGRAAELRAAMVSELCGQGKVTRLPVEAAFRVVPRERFMPAGTDLAVAYGFDSSVVTKRDEHGVAISSVSAAYIQARMLELAELVAGATVLEVGSGGLNAALIAEIIGPNGRVVSVDGRSMGHRARLAGPASRRWCPRTAIDHERGYQDDRVPP